MNPRASSKHAASCGVTTYWSSVLSGSVTPLDRLRTKSPLRTRSGSSMMSLMSLSDMGRSSPKPPDRVQVQHRVGADDRNALDHRLGHQEPVERIFVMKRQANQRRRVLRLNGQDHETEPVQAGIHEVLVRPMQGELA